MRSLFYTFKERKLMEVLIFLINCCLIEGRIGCYTDWRKTELMGKLWTFLTHLNTIAGPIITLMYPLYASVCAIESTSKEDDEQWLAYWILYSFITLVELALESIIYWIPIWYPVKVVFMAWLVLPQFRGASLIYKTFVRDQLRQHHVIKTSKDHHK